MATVPGWLTDQSGRSLTGTPPRGGVSPKRGIFALPDDQTFDVATRAQRGEILTPDQVASGWGNGKRKMSGAGDARMELARVYKKAARGEITVEDMARITYTLERFAKIAELADAEKRIEALEARVEALTRGRS